MSFKKEWTETRSSVDINFWESDSTVKSYIATTYPERIATDSFSEDNLQKTRTLIFPNQSVFDTYFNDAIIVTARQDRKAHNLSNNINININWNGEV